MKPKTDESLWPITTEWDIHEPIRTRSKTHVTSVKRGKTSASKTRLVLVLLLIGWETGGNFSNQSQSVVKHVRETPNRACLQANENYFRHLNENCSNGLDKCRGSEQHISLLSLRYFVFRYKERVGSIRRELQGAKSIAEDYRVRGMSCMCLLFMS